MNFCRSKYKYNESGCNPLIEPIGMADKPNAQSPECEGKDLFCYFGICKYKNRVRNKGQSCDDDINCVDEYDCTKGKCGPYHWKRRPGEPCETDIFKGGAIDGHPCKRGKCTNGKCKLIEDYQKCSHDWECRSNICPLLRGTHITGTKYCQPKDGFKNGSICWENEHSQCASNR